MDVTPFLPKEEYHSLYLLDEEKIINDRIQNIRYVKRKYGMFIPLINDTKDSKNYLIKELSNCTLLIPKSMVVNIDNLPAIKFPIYEADYIVTNNVIKLMFKKGSKQFLFFVYNFWKRPQLISKYKKAIKITFGRKPGYLVVTNLDNVITLEDNKKYKYTNWKEEI